jgi:hypothetical protein
MSAHRVDAATEHHYAADLTCGPGHDVTATFIVAGGGELKEQFGAVPDELWIDLSLFDNNFAPGMFIGAGPFVPAAVGGGGFFPWHSLLASRVHYYRVNARFGNQWREAGRGSFETPNCDFVTRLSCFLNGSALQQVHFAVPPASPIPGLVAVQQWIDLTLFANPRNTLLDNGFLPGTFVGAGPFAPSGGQFDWDGIVAGQRHHYRLNTFYSDVPARWVEQFSGSFVSLDCRNLPKELQLPA